MAAILIAIAFVVILPFLTYYATSTLFFRQVNSKTPEKKPPTLPYFIPGLFHATSFAQLGARKYFAELIKEYGAFAPFRVRAGPSAYVVLRDPTHISRVLDAPEHLSADAVEAEISSKLFDSPKVTQYLDQNRASIPKADGAGISQETPFDIPDTTIVSITELYISRLSANMHDKMFQLNSWTRIEDLWSFLQLVLVRCTLDTLFGSMLLKQYPRMVRDYLEFDASIEGFVYGMPRMAISGASKPRDRLYEGMRKWLTASRIPNNNADKSEYSSKDAPGWDEKSGFPLIHEHCHNNRLDKLEKDNMKASAAEVLKVLHSTSTGLVPITFWMIVESLRKSHLTRNLTTSLGQSFSPNTHKYDVLKLTQESLVKSLQTEVYRLRTATSVVRTNKTDGFPLDKQWSLPKGTAVIMFSNDISLNTDAWKKAQPGALDKPLEEFWAERFAVPEHKSKFKKNAVVDTSGSATTELGEIIIKLAGCNQYPGSRLVSALQVATLAVMFTEFEVQLCDTDQVDEALPPISEFAFGTIKPLEKIPVRIKKRQV